MSPVFRDYVFNGTPYPRGEVEHAAHAVKYELTPADARRLTRPCSRCGQGQGGRGPRGAAEGASAAPRHRRPGLHARGRQRAVGGQPRQGPQPGPRLRRDEVAGPDRERGAAGTWAAWWGPSWRRLLRGGLAAFSPYLGQAIHHALVPRPGELADRDAVHLACRIREERRGPAGATCASGSRARSPSTGNCLPC